jgi:succinyl-CoA synthetase alpha subunit
MSLGPPLHSALSWEPCSSAYFSLTVGGTHVPARGLLAASPSTADSAPVSYTPLMAILVDKSSRVVVAGATGKEGSFHTGQMVQYGTNVVAGVTPGKEGESVHGVPVFNTMKGAVAATGADAAIVFVPAPFAADSVLEAVDAGIPFVTLITEGVPVNDMIRVVAKIHAEGKSRLLGGNCAGIITPGQCKMGIMPGQIFKEGPVGMVSRSGTLTYEIAFELTRADLGQTTCVGIGGDPVIGTRFVEVLEMFENDPATEVVVMIGEIGGTDEEAGAEFIKTMSKPVVSFISGRTAPPGKRMGHAGAIISGGLGTPQSKVDALLAAGASVADSTSQVPALVKQALAARV